MIEPGFDYRIEMMEGDSHSYRTVTVLDWDAPLAKVKDGDKELVINFASTVFVSAERKGKMANPLGKYMTPPAPGT